MLMDPSGFADRNDDQKNRSSDREDALFSINFADLMAAIYRARISISVIMAACVALGIVITFLSTPIFRATAKVQIDQEAAKVLGTEQTDVSASIQDTERFLQTQLDVLRSRTVATAVADELRLFRNPRFLEAMGVNPGVKVPPNMTAAEANRDIVLRILDKNMAVTLPRDSRIASIQFDSPDAALAARVANSFADNFIRNNLQRKFDTSAYSREFLNSQLKQAQSRLERSERLVVEFAERTRIVDPGAASDTQGNTAAARSLLNSTLVQLNTNLADATSKRLVAQGEWDRARQGSVMSLPDVLSNPAIQQLVKARAEQQATYQEQLKRRRVDYPGMAEARAGIAEADAQIARLGDSIRRSAKTRLDVAAAQEENIRTQVDRLKSAALGEQREGIQLSILRREADTNRQQFEALLRRVNQLNAESGVQTNNISVIDRAEEPIRPAWPKILLNVALSLFVGAALAAVYVLVREQLFGRIRTPDDVTARLKLPLLGAIPDASEQVDGELNDLKSDLSEAFNTARTAMSLASSEGLPRIFTFSSTQKGEGKSTICYAIARKIANTGKRVVVVDLDLRRPNQHRLFGVGNEVGVSGFLSGNSTLADVRQTTSFPNVDIVSSGLIPPNPTDLLISEQLRQLLVELSAIYDHVLVDSPPVLGLADAIIIGSRVDGIVFVTQSGQNSPKSVQTAIRRIAQSGTRIVGVILSRYDPGRSGYLYEQDHAYHYRYGAAE